MTLKLRFQNILFGLSNTELSNFRNHTFVQREIDKLHADAEAGRPPSTAYGVKLGLYFGTTKERDRDRVVVENLFKLARQEIRSDFAARLNSSPKP